MTLTIGIDVGGTHTDAVLISKDKVHKKVKISTDHDDLLSSTLEALKKIYDPNLCQDLKRICISTTLSTNSIVENKYDKVGLILIPGPGVAPKDLPFADQAKVIDGYVDHRGKVVKEINRDDVLKVLNDAMAEGAEYVSIVGKFSNRNPKLELDIKNIISEEYPQVKYISLGHQVAGRLNFPRRISTSYFNAAIYRTHHEFVETIKSSLKELNIDAPTFVLKGDGGTVSLEDSKEHCVHTILSGPAASIMGKIALTGEHKSAFFLDLGGTTTDIGVMLNGSPVFKPRGADIGGHKTSVRALYSESLGVGGDSVVKIEDKSLKIGPERKGPAIAYGGDTITPTDAAIYLNSDLWKNEVSKDEVKDYIEESMEELASQMELTSEEMSKRIIEETARIIGDKILEMAEKISNRPVYTVKEVLAPLKLNVDNLIGIGGPAHFLLPYVAKYLNASYQLTSHYDVANAIGAGVARPTTVATVHCDTANNYYVIPELGVKEKIDGISKIDDVIEIAKNAIKDRAKRRKGYDDIDFSKEIEITYQEEFNMVRNFNTIGKVYEVGAQIKPGPVFSLLNA